LADPYDFTDLLSGADIDPATTKLLRHDRRGLSALKRGEDWFGSFISIQRADNSPFSTEAQYAAHFVPGLPLSNGSSSAVFVGVTEVHGRWDWDPDHLPRLWLAEDTKNPKHKNEAVDQAWLDTLSEHSRRLMVDWGFSPRSWHQWANKNRKPIIEMNGSERSLAKATSVSGVSLFLTEAEKFDETLAYEEREISLEIEREKGNIDREYRSHVSEVRKNQGAFRKILLQRYGTKCCVTGCTVPEVLEAAHIIPFRKGLSCRDSPSNGLLLRRDIHRLFDLMLLSIDPEDFSIWVNPSLRHGEYGNFHGLETEILASKNALAEHFAHLTKLSRPE
jgi:hypothetical protein